MENEIIHDAFFDMDDGTDELYHYGRKGMKWYQNIFTSGKERSVKRRRVKNLKKARKAKAKKVEEAKKAAEEKANYEAEKCKAIETGSAADVLRFKGQLTANEMQYVSTRLTWERNMRDLRRSEVESGKTASDKIIKNVGKITDVANASAKAWNTFANIYNAFSKKEVSLPKIDTNITSGNKELRRDEKRYIEAKSKQAKAAAEKAARQRTIETASRETIMKNFGKLSVDDLKIASQRASFEGSIEKNWKVNTNQQTVNAGKEAVDSILDDDK